MCDGWNSETKLWERMKAIVILGHIEVSYHSPVLKEAYRIIINNFTERGYIEDGYRIGRIIHEYLSMWIAMC